MTVNTQKPIVIFRGDNTAAFDLRTIKILLTGDLDLTNATARFDLLDFTKSWTTEEVATGELSIVFDSAQTKAFALGPQVGTLRLYDMSTGSPRQLTIINKIPFFVTNRVCELDNQNYEADVCVTSGEVIHVEFNVGVGAVEGKADKVKNATAGDLAGLNAEGNLTDSGISASDVLRKSQMDDTPTAGSQNPVTSDGIKQAIDAATPSDYAQVKAQVEQNTTDISTINGKIPAQASAQNQLADKNFVNSSIATNTANFLGTYDYVTDLGFPQPSSSADVSDAAIATALGSLTFPQTPTNNDYVFVQIDYTATTPADEFRRFKFNGTAWAYEYTLNNSSFTADQWAAINSGITSGLVEKLNGIEAGAQVNTVTGVKGSAEQDYRTGNINLTPANIGALPLTGGTVNGYVLMTAGLGVSSSVDGAIYFVNGGKSILIRQEVSGTQVVASLKLTSKYGNSAFAMVDDIASKYDSTATYTLNALCVYEGVLYRCTTAIETAEAWTAAHWTEATVEDVLAAIRTALDAKAPLASPAFTGTPTAPTPTAGDNSTKVATTAFVQGALPYAIASVPSGDALADRTVNTKTVNASTYAPSFPAETSGKSCDFYLAITSDTAGTVSAPSGKTLYNAKGDSANLDYEANKTTVLRFTQIGTNTYVVTGGANGGGSVDPAQLAGKLNSTSAAPAFSSSATYAVGDYVTYQGDLYVCSTAVSTAGDWTGSTNWTAANMTSPDATFDVTSQNALRLVDANGNRLWMQGYNLETPTVTSGAATLSNEAVNYVELASTASADATVTISLPARTTGKVSDFVLDVANKSSANTLTLALDSNALDTTFGVVVPDGDDLTTMFTIAAGEMAEFYFTLTQFTKTPSGGSGTIPMYKVVKQVVVDATEASA